MASSQSQSCSVLMEQGKVTSCSYKIGRIWGANTPKHTPPSQIDNGSQKYKNNLPRQKMQSLYCVYFMEPRKGHRTVFLSFFISLPRDSKSFPQDRKSSPLVSKSFPQVRKPLPQDTNSFPQVSKSLPQDVESFLRVLLSHALMPIYRQFLCL